MISCVFLVASTTAYLLEAQEPRDWKNFAGTVVLKSGTFEIDRTSQDLQDGVPTKVYVRTDSGLKSLQFEKISPADRRYVRQELGLPEAVEVDSCEKDLAVVPVSDGLRSPTKEKYAFLVAASHYDADVTSLLYTGNDVDDLKKRLLELGFREENIVVLRSGIDFGAVPTKEHIESSYSRFLSRVQPGDLVFVYLSGHGLQLAESDVSYFAPVDVKLKDIENTAVSINAMMSELSDSPAEFRWMIVDACRNDPKNKKGIFTSKAPGAKGMANLANIPNSISLLQSCQPGACSYEGGGNVDSTVHNGVFTLALLEALGEEGKGDLNGDGAVSFLEICQYVTKRANALANYYHHAEQKPNLSGNLTDFAFLEGLAKGEAAKLYQAACELIRQKNYSSALAKIRSACEKDPENQVYADMKEMLEENERIRLAAEKAEQERIAAEERAKKAEEERKRREAEAQIANNRTNASSSSSSSSNSSSSWTGNFSAGTRKTLNYKGVEFSFRYCPSGIFTMGSPSDENGRWGNEPQREVNIDEGFWICETETTQAQWDAVGLKKEEYCRFKGAKLPVENVSWHESDSFIKKLNALNVAPEGWRFALPTEEQWEYACRAGTSGSTYGVSLDEAAWYGETLNSGSTHEVGTKKPNNWGVYDMLGNVWEWTSSRYNGGSSFVDRGGGWNFVAQYCRPAERHYYVPTYCYVNLGFRGVLVRSESR